MNIEETKNLIKQNIATLLKFSDDLKKSKFGETALESPYTDLIYDGELIVGTKVSIKNQAGDIVSAPDGTHTMSDGKIITIIYGSVSQIKDNSTDTTSTEDKPAETETPNTETQMETNIESTPVEPAIEETKPNELEERIGKLETEIASIMDTLKDLTGNTTEMMSKVVELSKQPATKPLEFKKENLNTVSTEDVEAKRERFKKLLKSK